MEQTIESSFKITRFPATAMVCDFLVEIAARSNGLPQDKKVTMAELISYAKCEILRTNGEGYTISPIDEHHLIIDRRQEPALEIIEVEIVDLTIPPPMEDFGHSAN
jgi:hypothetical protein